MFPDVCGPRPIYAALGTKMRPDWLVCLVAVAVASGCAGRSTFMEKLERYQALAAEPTPVHWAAGAVWAFVTTDRRGYKNVLVFRISDEVAETCSYGDWRVLELQQGELGSLAGTPFRPAALVEGRHLWISLTSNWCDINNDLKGELQGLNFTGQHTSGGMMGSTVIGPVRGWRVE